MASHPSPFNRQRQSTKALDPSGPTAKFLYTILKQLDLKNIDWNEVASGLDITNGHAARMRWSRFRAQIEGSDNSYSRKPSKKKDGEKKRKKERDEDGRLHGKSNGHQNRRMKTEGAFSGELDNQYHRFQNEVGSNTSIINGVTVHHPTMTQVPLHQDRSAVPNSGPVRREDQVSAKTNMQPPSSIYDAQKSVYKPPATPKSSQRPQQYFNAYGQYPPLSSAQTPTFYNNPYSYGNQYQNPSMYANQYQPRYRYGQQAGYPVQMQQPQMYNMDHVNRSTTHLRMANSTNAAQKGMSTNMQPPKTNMSGEKHTSTAQSTTQSSSMYTPTVPAQVYEMASDASYPWPYSETAIPDFLIDPALMVQPNNSNPLALGEINNAPNGAPIPLVDLSVFKPSPNTTKPDATKQNNVDADTRIGDTITVNQNSENLPKNTAIGAKESEEVVAVVKIEPGQ